MKNYLYCKIVTVVAVVITSISAYATPQPTLIKRISSKFGCGKSSISGKFQLGTLNPSGVFKAISGKKLLEAKYKTANSICKKLKGVAASLTSLPLTSSFYAQSQTESLSRNTVSGTPPLLSSIDSSGATNYFWRPGVIENISSGIPNEIECREFHGNLLDGQSAGLTACEVGENIVEQLFVGSLLDQSTCYLKQAISSLTLGRGVSVTAGRLPSGGADLLFDPSSDSSSRIVKINIEGFGEEIFVSIPSTSINREAGFDYSLSSWSCKDGRLNSYKSTSLRSRDLLYSHQAKLSSITGATYRGELTGYLRAGSSGISPDLTRTRTIEVSSHGIGADLKTRLTIGGDGYFENQIYRSSGSNIDATFAAARISGESSANFRLYETATAYQKTASGTVYTSGNAASEFRESSYVSVPSNVVSSRLSPIELASNSFYSTAPDIGFDPDLYSCTTAADVTLNVDLSNSEIITRVSSCFPSPSPISRLCKNPAVLQATMNYRSKCP